MLHCMDGAVVQQCTQTLNGCQCHQLVFLIIVSSKSTVQLLWTSIIVGAQEMLCRCTTASPLTARSAVTIWWPGSVLLHTCPQVPVVMMLYLAPRHQCKYNHFPLPNSGVLVSLELDYGTWRLVVPY